MTGSQMLDFNRSFLTFTTLDRGNNARIQIEARCTLTETSSAASYRYVMIASCKAEDTYGEGLLFKQPNYDFSGVFSDSDYAIYRHFASADDNQPESGPLHQLFDRIEILETPLRSARRLTEPEEIIGATLAGLPLSARTVFRSGDERFVATLDYPIKTMNVNPERGLLQVDTGPLLFPERISSASRVVDAFVPAFVAYRTFDQAEFITLNAVRISGQTRVNHYATVRVVNAETTIFAAD